MGRTSAIPKNKLGEVLRTKRLEKGYKTLDELAKVCDIRVSSLSKYEIGGVIPRSGVLERLNKILDVNLEEYIENPIKHLTPIIDFKIENVIRAENKDQIIEIHEKEKVTSLTLNKPYSQVQNLSMEAALVLLNDISQSWLTNSNTFNILLSGVGQSEYNIKELSSTLIIKKDLIIVMSSNSESSLFIDSIGFPTAHLHHLSMYHTVWINFQLNELQQLERLREVFLEESLHYYNNRLVWLAMKTKYTLN